MMNVLRYIEILQAYGARPSRWPQAERHPMTSFSEKFEDASRLLEEEAQLDQLLDLAQAPAPSEFLKARIIASIKKARPVSVASKRKTYFEFAALAASLLAGVFIGTSNVPLFQSAPVTEETVEPIYVASNETTLNDYSWLNDTFDETVNLDSNNMNESYFNASISDILESSE